jgi:F420-non-reducing hydrogenase large subunit
VFDDVVLKDPATVELVLSDRFCHRTYSIAEAVLPYSYLKYPYLKKVGWKGLVDGADSGVYRATPLSRLNVSEGMATPLAQAEYERLYDTLTGDRSGRKPVHATLAIPWARVIELVFACEAVAAQARDHEITSDEIHVPPTSIVGEGVGSWRPPGGCCREARAGEVPEPRKRCSPAGHG